MEKTNSQEERKIDYQRIDWSLIDRIVRLTGRPADVFLRRGVFFAHRDFNDVLDAYERGEKNFYLYPGRGPSSSSEPLHLGHLMPFMFTKYLQDAFKVPVVIQLTDEETFMWKEDVTVEECQRIARENAKDIIACGFDVSRTFIFSNYDYVRGSFFKNRCKIAKCVKYNEVEGIFGFNGEDHMGKVGFTPVQDPYFRMTREVAPQLGYHKPALIESSFLPGLHGGTGKMSTSDPNSAIYVTDSAEDIKKKINKFAFSGGQDSVENHRKYGANLEVDIPFKYLEFFLEDDNELEHIRTEYGSGRMLTGEVKNRLIEVLKKQVEKHRSARAAVTDEMVDEFMAVRPLPDMFS